jgi:UrcA family protein
MRKYQTLAIASVALSLFWAVSPASALARPSEQAAEPFRFAYSAAELQDGRALRAMETRLRSEAADFCRRTMSGSPVVQLSCARSMVRATRSEIRTRIG